MGYGVIVIASNMTAQMWQPQPCVEAFRETQKTGLADLAASKGDRKPRICKHWIQHSRPAVLRREPHCTLCPLSNWTRRPQPRMDGFDVRTFMVLHLELIIALERKGKAS